MVGSTGTLMTMRLVRSKLRKREESSNNISQDQPPTQVATIATTVEQQTTLQGHTIPQPVAYGQCPSSVWVFPPLPPQPHLYSTNSQDLLIQANEKTSGLRGFRKQFSGRFKRLVSRKEEPQLSAIPPELKPQLKTIYVY